MKTERTLFADAYLVVHTVSPAQQGQRLDSFLKKVDSHRSRERIKKDIRSGKIEIKRPDSSLSIGKIRPSTLLQAGDEIHLRSEKKAEPPVSFDYKVLYEDENLFVIDKPAHLPVHPAGGFFFHTLLVHLKTKGFTEPFRPEREFFLVHRIDKETSGVLILTKDKESCAHLTEQFTTRKTKKKYLAITHGIPKEKQFSVDARIGKDPFSKIRLKMRTIPTNDPHYSSEWTALTDFNVLSEHTIESEKFSLIECFPKTGRQHQIRLHLAHIGHPIVGDKLYSLKDEDAIRFYERPHFNEEESNDPFDDVQIQKRLILPRQALHAAAISFIHPKTKKEVYFESPLPKDLHFFLEGRIAIQR
ncbi:MAG: hypothetical protein CL678_17015 [Bdellovibrionaceae bacterium]|nr:hypothetical protein [Pseudobdellovibrionaceae bacterium]|tara:strand:+ start:1193 stop:2269 length:1077 start_codon:yes stop_codon:yes gene_type:complete